MGELGILGVCGNDHRVAPDVRALGGHIEAHVFVFIKHHGRVAGVDNGNILVAVHHTVDDLVGHINGGHRVVHLQQPLVGGIDLIGIFGVHRVAQRLERHHKGIALRVVDVDVAGVIGVAQDLPALALNDRGVDILVVVDKTHAAPEVGDRPVVLGIVAHAAHGVVHVLHVGDQALVERLEEVLFHQALDHVVRRDHHVVAVTRHELGVHHLVGVEVFDDDAHAELLFKVGDDILAQILAGEIELQDVAAVLLDGLSTLALLGDACAHRAAENGQHQHACDDRHGLVAYGAGSLAVLLALFTYDRHDVHHAERQRNEQDHDGGECVDRGIDALGHRVNQDRDVVHAVARRKIGDNEVIEAHREGDERAGDDAGLDLRDDDLRERLEGRRAKIHRRVDEVGVERAELGRDGEHHIGNAEHDVREQQRTEAFFDREHAEEHQKRDSRDNIGVHHGQVVDALDHFLHDLAGLRKTDGRDRADDGGDDGGNKGDDDRVEHSLHHRRVCEHLFIPAQGESTELGE